MSNFQPCCLPTAVGSLPHTDPREACDLVLRCLPEIPVWPQLPNRTPLESMYVQYFQRFPSAIFDGDKVHLNGTHQSLDDGLARLYADYLDASSQSYTLDPQAAAGFAEMRLRWNALPRRPVAVKGQITGPISAGLQITDAHLRPLLYDEILGDALAKYLRLTAIEHERALGEASEQTIVFIDEPYLSAIGSAFIQIRREQVGHLLGEVLSGLKGLTGIHCCGNTDWSLVLSNGFDILSFDAYDHSGTLALYAPDVKSFLDRGGVVAWGIVPTNEATLLREDVESLRVKLLAGVELLVGKGIDRDRILAQSLITPSCGLGSASLDGAKRALVVTAALAKRLRHEFFDICPEESK